MTRREDNRQPDKGQRKTEDLNAQGVETPGGHS